MGRLGERREGRGMITKEQFFQYYRSDKYSNELTSEEKIEVFLMSLEGSSDITIDLLFALCNEYDVDLEKLLEGENEL
jgi:hypothetical protein